MLKRLLLTVISTALLIMGIKPALADTIIENVALSGSLNVGTSFDLVPYAYVNPEGELEGYSIDLLKLIKEELERELGRSIELNFVEANGVQEIIPKMISGEIDIACNNIFTWQRDKYVDFTVRYSLSGIRLLVPKSSIDNADTSFKGKKIGIPPLTFLEDAIKLVHPDAVFVKMETIQDGATALKEGQIDALAGDVVILDGIRQQLNPDGFEQFPPLSENPYARYGVACMVPNNNSTFLHIANHTMVKMMEGYIVQEPKYTEMVNKWFGKEGITSVISEDQIKEFYQNTIINHEQIPLSEQNN
jgi:polar amino acid transport system substrate-binding protein